MDAFDVNVDDGNTKFRPEYAKNNINLCKYSDFKLLHIFHYRQMGCLPQLAGY
jgi:hypothetical protein